MEMSHTPCQSNQCFESNNNKPRVRRLIKAPLVIPTGTDTDTSSSDELEQDDVYLEKIKAKVWNNNVKEKKPRTFKTSSVVVPGPGYVFYVFLMLLVCFVLFAKINDGKKHDTEKLKDMIRQINLQNLRIEKLENGLKQKRAEEANSTTFEDKSAIAKEASKVNVVKKKPMDNSTAPKQDEMDKHRPFLLGMDNVESVMSAASDISDSSMTQCDQEETNTNFSTMTSNESEISQIPTSTPTSLSTKIVPVANNLNHFCTIQQYLDDQPYIWEIIDDPPTETFETDCEDDVFEEEVDTTESTNLMIYTPPNLWQSISNLLSVDWYETFWGSVAYYLNVFD